MKYLKFRKYTARVCGAAVLAAGIAMPAFSATSEIKTGETVTITNTDWSSILDSTVTMSGGTLVSNNASTSICHITTAFTFADATSSTITSNGNTHLAIDGALTGSGTFTKYGTQQILLVGNNSGFTGTAVIASQWFNFQNTGASFSNGTVQLSGGSGFVLNPSSNNDVFEFGMITSTVGDPELRVTSGNAYSPTIQVGGTNASGVFAGHMKNNGGSLSVTKTGTGTWALTGANTYTGATNIENGTLQIGNHTQTGSLAGMTDTDTKPTSLTTITVGENGTLAFDLTTTSGLQVRVFNTLVFNGGTIKNLGTKDPVLVGTISGSEMTAAGGNIFFQGGTAAGNAVVTVENINVTAGLLATKVAMDSTKTIHIEGGAFQFGTAAGSTLGSVASTATINVAEAGTLIMYDQSIAAALSFNGGKLSGLGTGTLSGTLAGTGLTKVGAGTIQLTGTNAFAGTVTVSEGTLTTNHTHSGNVAVSGASSVFQVGNGGSTGSVADSSTIALSSGGTFQLNQVFDGTNYGCGSKFTITNGGTIAALGGKNLVLQGTLSGNNLTLKNSGTGTLFIQDAGNFTGLTGTLTIAQGLIVDKNNAVGSAANPLNVVVQNGATLQMGNGYSTVAPKIYGDIQLAGNGLLAFYAACGMTQSYAISSAGAGEGRVHITGNAEYTFTTDNSAFTGALFVNTGILNASGTNTLGNSAMTVKTGALVNVNGNQTLRSLDLQSGSSLNLKNGILTVSGITTAFENEIRINVTGIDTSSLVFDGETTFEDMKIVLYSDDPDLIDEDKSYVFLKTSVAEGFMVEISQELQGLGMSVQQISSGVYAFQMDRDSVPEPASWVLLLSAVALGFWKRGRLARKPH